MSILKKIAEKTTSKLLKNNKSDEDNTGVTIPEIDLESEYNKLTHLNIMVCGKTGVGKSTLISAIFTDEKIETGVGLPVTQEIEEYTKAGSPLSIYDCPGFELDNDQRENVMEQIKHTVQNHNIHCIWYCINVMASKIERPEAESINLLHQLRIPDGSNGYRNLPVIIVLTQAYSKERVNGLEKAIRTDCGLTDIPIVNVVAKEDNIDGHKIKPQNLDKLIDVSISNMGIEARDTLISMQMVNLRQKQKKSYSIIKWTAISAFTVGAAPIPFADAPVLAAAEVAMITKITVVFGMDIDKGTIYALVSSALGAGGACILGREFVSWLMKMTGAGAIVGGAFAGTTAMILTTTLGEAYMQLMKLAFIGDISQNALTGKEGRKLFKELFKKAMKNKDKSKFLESIKEKINFDNSADTVESEE